MKAAYLAVVSSLSGEAALEARALVASCEFANRLRPELERERVTMVVFGAWMRARDPLDLGVPISEWTAGLDSAAACARALTPEQAQAVDSTLARVAERLQACAA